MVPEQAGLVGDVEAGVEAEAGAQPPLVVAQHLVARQPEDRGHAVQVRYLAALATSRVPEQYICKIPSLMLSYLLVGTLFPVSTINIQHPTYLTGLGSALGGSGSPASRAFFLSAFFLFLLIRSAS